MRGAAAREQAGQALHVVARPVVRDVRQDLIEDDRLDVLERERAQPPVVVGAQRDVWIAGHASAVTAFAIACVAPIGSREPSARNDWMTGNISRLPSFA